MVRDSGKANREHKGSPKLKFFGHKCTVYTTCLLFNKVHRFRYDSLRLTASALSNGHVHTFIPMQFCQFNT